MIAKTGTVFLVGAGPGDPELMTLKGVRLLAEADVIIHDRLIPMEVLDWCREDAVKIDVGKYPEHHRVSQEEIHELLVLHANRGHNIVRLKGGDPFVFGRGGEEAQTLVSAGVPIRIVPGISAGIGGLAYAGIPVTHRDANQAVTFLTGHDQTGDAPGAIDWEALAKSSPVIVCYMAIKTLPKIAAALIAGGRSPSEPVAVVCNATLPQMAVVETTLRNAVRDVEAAGVQPPAIVCIGEVVRMRQVLDWMGQIAGDSPRDLDPLGSRSMTETG